VQRYDVNILNADQHQDAELGLFFMRVEFSTDAQVRRARPLAGRMRSLNGAARRNGKSFCAARRKMR